MNQAHGKCELCSAPMTHISETRARKNQNKIAWNVYTSDSTIFIQANVELSDANTMHIYRSLLQISHNSRWICCCSEDSSRVKMRLKKKKNSSWIGVCWTKVRTFSTCFLSPEFDQFIHKQQQKKKKKRSITRSPHNISRSLLKQTKPIMVV